MVLEFKTFILSVEKLTNIMINNYLIIPYEGNTWNVFAKIKFAKKTAEKLKQMSKLCIGKTMFKDHFGKNGFVYTAQLYNSNGEFLESEKEKVAVVMPLPPTEEKVGGNTAKVTYKLEVLE